MLAVAAATTLPRSVGSLQGAGSELGTVVLYLFFATAGWTGGALGATTLLAGAGALLAFLLVLYGAHLAVVLAGGAALSRASPALLAPLFSRPLLLVASNANIGGPATASALAVGCGWPSLVTPALLVGNLGYAVATPLCLFLHALLA